MIITKCTSVRIGHLEKKNSLTLKGLQVASSPLLISGLFVDWCFQLLKIQCISSAVEGLVREKGFLLVLCPFNI